MAWCISPLAFDFPVVLLSLQCFCQDSLYILLFSFTFTWGFFLFNGIVAISADLNRVVELLLNCCCLLNCQHWVLVILQWVGLDNLKAPSPGFSKILKSWTTCSHSLICKVSRAFSPWTAKIWWQSCQFPFVWFFLVLSPSKKTKYKHNNLQRFEKLRTVWKHYSPLGFYHIRPQ